MEGFLSIQLVEDFIIGGAKKWQIDDDMEGLANDWPIFVQAVQSIGQIDFDKYSKCSFSKQ